jgi:hypothetical protein
MNLEAIKMRWSGLRPLVMSNVRGVDPLDPLVIQLGQYTKKRSKDLTPSDREKVSRIEWELSAYHDTEVGFYMPSQNIERCLRDGGAKARVGKKIEAGAFLSEVIVPLKNQGRYKELDKAYEQAEYKLRTAVRLPPKTGARLMKTRACIPTGWTLEFTVEFDNSVIDSKELLEAAVQAGALVGLGNWRPKFGRFTVEKI